MKQQINAHIGVYLSIKSLNASSPTQYKKRFAMLFCKLNCMPGEDYKSIYDSEESEVKELCDKIRTM